MDFVDRPFFSICRIQRQWNYEAEKDIGKCLAGLPYERMLLLQWKIEKKTLLWMIFVIFGTAELIILSSEHEFWIVPVILFNCLDRLFHKKTTFFGENLKKLLFWMIFVNFGAVILRFLKSEHHFWNALDILFKCIAGLHQEKMSFLRRKPLFWMIFVIFGAVRLAFLS